MHSKNRVQFFESELSSEAELLLENDLSEDDPLPVNNIATSSNDAGTKARTKLTKEQRSQIWQKHLDSPKMTQFKLAEWAKNEFQLEKLTQATVSMILKEFRSSSSSGGNLTNEQAQLILNKSKQSKMSQKKLANWAKKQFNLQREPCQATISNIVNNKRSLSETLDEKTSKIKRKRVVKCPELDNILAEWVLQRQHNRVILTWQLIQRKAEDFADQLHLSDEKRPNFSDGWLEKFLDRHGLKTIILSGESGSADVKAIEIALPELQSAIKQYSPKDVFNMDETGLFYCLTPDRTIATRQLEGMKKDKTRISIALCCNADGSEKLELLIIGHAAKPRAFNKKTGKELGFYYRNNKKAWMTTLLFQEWLQDFDSRMRRQQRKVLLLLDNAPTHGVKNLTLSNVNVLFLPPNTTSRIQPLDAGIIAAFKKRYRSFHLAHAIDRDAAGEKELYKVDILKAMRWCRAAWNAMSADTIVNCWNHTGLMSAEASPSTTLPGLVADCDIDELLVEHMKQLNLSSPLSMEEMAEHEAEVEVHCQLEDSDLIELFSESLDEQHQDNGLDGAEPQFEEILIEDKIKALKLTLNLLVDEPLENDMAIRGVRKLLFRLSKEKSEEQLQSLKQLDIRSFMSK